MDYHVIRKHIGEMMGTRGYNCMTEFKNESTSTDIDTIYKHKKQSKITYVFLHDVKYRFGIKELRNYYLLVKTHYTTAKPVQLTDKISIIIVVDKINSNDITKTINNIKSSENILIEIWNYIFFKSNITKHHLVPKHELCSKTEKQNMIDYYGPLKQFPFIKVYDPQVKYLGAKVGSLIKIYRNSDTMPGETVITYRVVVH